MFFFFFFFFVEQIKAFRDSRVNRFTDTELVKLTDYLNAISDLDDFTVLDHRNWRKYVFETLGYAIMIKQ